MNFNFIESTFNQSQQVFYSWTRQSNSSSIYHVVVSDSAKAAGQQGLGPGPGWAAQWLAGGRGASTAESEPCWVAVQVRAAAAAAGFRRRAMGSPSKSRQGLARPSGPSLRPGGSGSASRGPVRACRLSHCQHEWPWLSYRRRLLPGAAGAVTSESRVHADRPGPLGARGPSRRAGTAPATDCGRGQPRRRAGTGGRGLVTPGQGTRRAAAADRRACDRRLSDPGTESRVPGALARRRRAWAPQRMPVHAAATAAVGAKTVTPPGRRPPGRHSGPSLAHGAPPGPAPPHTVTVAHTPRQLAQV